MKYFTPEILIRINSRDEDVADRADIDWKNAQDAYEAQLKSFRSLMPRNVRQLADKLCLHDADFLGIKKVVANPVAIVALRHDRDHDYALINLIYLLKGQVRINPKSKDWPFSSKCPLWMYDEVDRAHSGGFVHRILLSDGRTIHIPFSNIAIQKNVDPRSVQKPESPQLAHAG